MPFFGGQRMVQAEPGPIIGPIAMVFGYIVDIIFNFVYSFTINNSLGLSIILLTIFVRFLMVPLALKQQKSMMAMQRLNPEIQKIRNKYSKAKKDPEAQQKMNVEIQGLYSKNKVNPLGGCLPMFVQMPLFFGLSFIMHQSHLYVTRLGSLYTQLSHHLINSMPNYVPYGTHPQDVYVATMNNLAGHLIPARMIGPEAQAAGRAINLTLPEHVSRILNVLNYDEWRVLYNFLAPEYREHFWNLYLQKETIEEFFGMALTAPTGLSWPGIVIPFLAVVTTLGTSYVTSKMTVVTDERIRTQQRIMMTVMPVMMGVMTVGLPAGVGIYWITNSVIHIVQQIIFNYRAGISLFGKKET